ncbi:unnamed protein product [Lepeophtheirus salmonis]|uniref:(salmon louse) hypothetical protein n=1 Tax=Lepeophtheirus salmonis TaxID=72036 RepID=A0A7R8H6Y1_LEPSM|nr:unnamed protein product [Lepeophtheirus salmonis]CAF2909827.1 unnamed protein product [Lepeophtheirus salmonis]
MKESVFALNYVESKEDMYKTLFSVIVEAEMKVAIVNVQQESAHMGPVNMCPLRRHYRLSNVTQKLYGVKPEVAQKLCKGVNNDDDPRPERFRNRPEFVLYVIDITTI